MTSSINVLGCISSTPGRYSWSTGLRLDTPFLGLLNKDAFLGACKIMLVVITICPFYQALAVWGNGMLTPSNCYLASTRKTEFSGKKRR